MTATAILTDVIITDAPTIVRGRWIGCGQWWIYSRGLVNNYITVYVYQLAEEEFVIAIKIIDVPLVGSKSNHQHLEKLFSYANGGSFYLEGCECRTISKLPLSNLQMCIKKAFPNFRFEWNKVK